MSVAAPARARRPGPTVAVTLLAVLLALVDVVRLTTTHPPGTGR